MQLPFIPFHLNVEWHKPICTMQKLLQRHAQGPFSEPSTPLSTGVCTGCTRLSATARLGITVVAKFFHLESDLEQATACHGIMG